MQTEIIVNQWIHDAPVNSLNLGKAAGEIHELHAKYLKIWGMAKRDMIKAKIELKQLRAQKHDWMMNPTQEHHDKGWIYPDRKILKTDIASYLQADPDIIKAELNVGEHETAFEMLQEILKQIGNRNWLIKSAIDDRAFLAGE